MKSKQRLSEEILAVIHEERILDIRAGTESTHRIIGIWVVVDE
jgi:hypothetical protein